MSLGRGTQAAAVAKAMVLSRSADNALHEYVLTFGLVLGSCMTDIGHVRAAIKESHCARLGGSGAHTEMPGCSLYMGNQAQMREGATVAEYHEAMGIVNKDGAAIYKYLNFDQIEEYVENAKEATA